MWRRCIWTRARDERSLFCSKLIFPKTLEHIFSTFYTKKKAIKWQPLKVLAQIGRSDPSVTSGCQTPPCCRWPIPPTDSRIAGPSRQTSRQSAASSDGCKHQGNTLRGKDAAIGQAWDKAARTDASQAWNVVAVSQLDERDPRWHQSCRKVASVCALLKFFFLFVLCVLFFFSSLKQEQIVKHADGRCGSNDHRS